VERPLFVPLAQLLQIPSSYNTGRVGLQLPTILTSNYCVFFIVAGSRVEYELKFMFWKQQVI